jgi:hypothetical protein
MTEQHCQLAPPASSSSLGRTEGMVQSARPRHRQPDRRSPRLKWSPESVTLFGIDAGKTRDRVPNGPQLEALRRRLSVVEFDALVARGRGQGLGNRNSG